MSLAGADSPSGVSAGDTRFALGAVVTRADIPVLCADLEGMLRGRSGSVICDVAGVVRPDVVTVEALARLHLLARRRGWRLVVSGAGPALLQLVNLLGLADALSESGRQPESGEEAGGVEEVVDRHDPSG
jgi:hypothetical protein